MSRILTSDGPDQTPSLAPVETIKISEIQILNRQRDVDMDVVDLLAMSIDAEGLIHPIAVKRATRGYILVSGAHRMEACFALGWKSIPAVIHEAGVRSEQIEFAENFYRKQLSAIELSDALAINKEIYELRFPMAKQGAVARHAKSLKRHNVVLENGTSESLERHNVVLVDREEMPPLKSFAAHTAEQMGMTARSIQRLLSIQKIAKPLRDDIKAKRPDLAHKRNELLKLVALPKNRHVLVVGRLCSGRVKTVEEAAQGEAGRKAAQGELFYGKVVQFWKTSKPDAQAELLRDLASTPLPEGFKIICPETDYEPEQD